jgi:hypothetical protein
MIAKKINGLVSANVMDEKHRIINMNIDDISINFFIDFIVLLYRIYWHKKKAGKIPAYNFILF